MVTFDTNVIVRLIVDDDEQQGRQARSAWRAALADGGIFLPMVVVVETSWVLRRAYRFDRATTVSTLSDLLNVEGVVVEGEEAVRSALEAFRHGTADFADYLIWASAAEALPVLTFDRRFARAPSVRLLD